MIREATPQDRFSRWIGAPGERAAAAAPVLHGGAGFSARFTGGRVGFAVGDIHGCADLLAEMLALLEQHARASTNDSEPPVVVFLGDYVDRGPDSRGVLTLLTSGAPYGFERRFLMGNHDQALVRFLDDPKRGRSWLAMGGMETLASYGVAPPALGASVRELERAASELHWAMPPEHVAFLRTLETSAIYGAYAFVHAGVDHRKPIERQREEDLLWNHAHFDTALDAWDYIVVHGHTPTDEPYLDWRRICVDTGAFHTGRLTAVRLEGESVEFLQIVKSETA